MDGEFELGREFLKLTTEQSEWHPCIHRRSCGFPHRVVMHAPTRLVAVAEGTECLPFKVEPHDLLVYAVDKLKFCGAMARAFKFESTPDGGGGLPDTLKVWPVGIYARTRSPVYLCLPGDFTLANIEGLINAQKEPFILLASSQRSKSAAMQSLLQRQRCEFIPLANSLALDGKGKFKIINSIQPILDRFAAGCVPHGPDVLRVVERIDRNIEAVARNQFELRKENEELRQLNKDGYFNFALRVKGDDFLAFAVIMAVGNRKAAADHLKIPHRTFYNRVDQWAKRGKDYQLMVRYMDWRKRSSRHLKVELTPSLQSGESGDQPENPDTIADVLEEVKAADNKSYPALLAEVFQALQRQNAGNWMKVRQDLLETIKEDVMQ